MKKKGPQAITSGTSIAQAQRRAEILKLRLDGLSLQEIGDRMNIKPDTVHGIITRALQAMTREPSGELLNLELARLESLYSEALKAVRAFTPVLHNGRVVQIPVIDSNGNTVTDESGQPLTCIAQDRAPVLAGIAAAVRIAERRHRLLGIDAPIKQAVTVSSPTEQDFSHLTVDDMEEIKARLYGGQRVLTHNQTESKEVH